MLSKRAHQGAAARVLAVAVAVAVVAWLAVTVLVVADDEPAPAPAEPVAAGAGTAEPRVEFRADGKYVDGNLQKEPENPVAAAPAADPAPADESAPRAGSAPATAPRGDLLRDLGQKIMSRMAGTSPGPDLLRRVRAGSVGGIILFGDNIRSLSQISDAVAQLQAAAQAGGNPPLLIAVDQEGGDVKRFGSLPPSVSAAQMGTPAAARDQGRRTATALAGLGVTVNLAPVADVPTSSQSFLGTRAFGRTPQSVAAMACGFARGLVEGGVAPALKHFPGLGAAGANTDLAAVRIEASAATLRQGYAPYERCASEAGLVMVASASYPALTGPGPAVLERATYTRELPRAGFSGATISDDLQTPALASSPQVAVRAADAGLDVLLFAKTEAAAAQGFEQMRAAVNDGRLTRAQIARSADRVRALKEAFAQ